MSELKSSRFPDLPSALHRRGIYYGWVVLFAGTVGILMSVPGQTMGVSVYTEFILKSLGMSRLRLSMAYMFGTLGSAFLLPIVGRFLDKVGARVVSVIASLGLSVFLILLAASPSITKTLVSLTHINHEWVALAVMFLSFLGIRHFGQGQLTMASRTMMGLWFERRRGLMLGISGFFVAFGFGVAPLTLTWMILRFQWQRSLVILASLLVAGAIFAWLVFRRSPEACGLVIDGGRYVDEDVTECMPEISFTVQQAKHTVAFWAFNFGMVAQALIVSAITFDMGSIGQLNKISDVKAFSVFLPVGIISTCADLLGGVISDRIPMKYLLAVMQLGIACGLLGLEFYGTNTGFAFTAIGFGISSGLFSLLMGAAWPKLFGREHLGAIAGINMSWIVAGSAIGPYLFSLGGSFSGDYKHVIYWFLAVPLSVFVLSFFASQPERKVLESTLP